MLKFFPEPLWGFFFGLVIASAIMISKQIQNWNASKALSLLAGIAIALAICLISPAEGSSNPLYIFVCGMIAISAFILPGISGSFMLLLLGTYTLIIPSLKSIMVNHDMASIYIILIFGMGCIVGIATFSRVLSYLFANFKEVTLVLLTGFLIGSLYKIWPWRNISIVVDKESGVKTTIDSFEAYSLLDIEHIKILKEVNVLPSDYWMSTPKLLVTLVAVILGFLTVYLIELNSKKIEA
jgi:putative membrane protein